VAIFSRDDYDFALAYVEKIYYPTHTRLDGLLVGVTLATIKTFRPVGGRAQCLMAIYCSQADSHFARGPCGYSMTACHFLDRLWAFLG
jgi:hypothetical protein